MEEVEEEVEEEGVVHCKTEAIGRTFTCWSEMVLDEARVVLLCGLCGGIGMAGVCGRAGEYGSSRCVGGSRRGAREKEGGGEKRYGIQ